MSGGRVPPSRESGSVSHFAAESVGGGADAIERERRATEPAGGEAADRAFKADRGRHGVHVDDRRAESLEVARPRVVVDAHAIADHELSERVDRIHRVQQMPACVDRSSDSRKVQIQLTRGDRLQ